MATELYGMLDEAPEEQIEALDDLDDYDLVPSDEEWGEDSYARAIIVYEQDEQMSDPERQIGANDTLMTPNLSTFDDLEEGEIVESSGQAAPKPKC